MGSRLLEVFVAMSNYVYKHKATIGLSEALQQARERQEASASPRENTSLPAYQPFIPPAAYTDAVAASLAKGEAQANFLSNIPGFVRTKPLNVTVRGIVVPANRNDKNPVVTNPFVPAGPSTVDRLAVDILHDPRFSPAFAKMMIRSANEHYFGSGTVPGLLRRIKEQIPEKSTPKLTPQEFLECLKLMPRNGVAKLSGDAVDPVSISPEMRLEAHPGAPYFLTGLSMMDVLPDVVATAMALYGTFKSGVKNVQDFFQTQEGHVLMVTMLCPKADIYKRSEFFTKVRPFGVHPGALRILFKCITGAVDPVNTNFLNHPDSISAFKFSWAHGGAEKLWDWAVKERPPGLYALTWGDDQLWLVVCKDGTSFILGPDVRGMDMKLCHPEFQLYLGWNMQAFSPPGYTVTYDDVTDHEAMARWYQRSKENINSEWYNILRFKVNFMEKHYVLATKQYVFHKSRGMLSGVDGTTAADLMASARLVNAVKKVPVPETVHPVGHPQVAKYLLKLSSVADDLGMPLKAETMIFQPLDSRCRVNDIDLVETFRVENDTCVRHEVHHEDVVLAIPFLGQMIREHVVPKDFTNTGVDERFLVPYMEEERIGLRIVYSDIHDKDPVARAGKQLAATLSQGFNAFSSPDLYKWLEEVYKRRRKMFPTAKADLEGISILEGMPVPEDVLEAADYPSPHYFASIFAHPDRQKHLVVPKPGVIDLSMKVGPPEAENPVLDFGLFDPSSLPAKKEGKRKDAAFGILEDFDPTKQRRNSSGTQVPRNVSRPPLPPILPPDMPVTSLSSVPSHARKVIEDMQEELSSIDSPAILPGNSQLVSAPKHVSKKEASQAPVNEVLKQARDLKYFKRVEAEIAARKAQLARSRSDRSHPSSKKMTASERKAEKLMELQEIEEEERIQELEEQYEKEMKEELEEDEEIEERVEAALVEAEERDKGYVSDEEVHFHDDVEADSDPEGIEYDPFTKDHKVVKGARLSEMGDYT